MIDALFRIRTICAQDMRGLVDITRHNITRCTSFLLANGYPILDTQNLHIKLRPEKHVHNTHHNSLFTNGVPPTRPTMMALILVSSLLYEYVYSEF